jgi:hypothetical protein
MKHSTIQNLLYDFTQNELTESERLAVEQHLSTCKRCSEELAGLRQTLALLPPPAPHPSDAREEALWQSLTLRVERAVHQSSGRSRRVGVMDRLSSFVALRPSLAFAVGGTLAVLVLAVAIFPLVSKQTPQVVQHPASPDDSSYVLATENVNERVGEYFRKSKALLIGIANMKTTDGVDLAAEQTVSRRLVHEARYLRHQPLDLRAAKLVNDLEKILIELANIEQNNDLPNVEMIRTGIHQENLLFRIRMAAASYDSTGSSRRIY